MEHQQLLTNYRNYINYTLSVRLWFLPSLILQGLMCHARPLSSITHSYSRGPNGDEGAGDRHAPHVGVAILQCHVDINADADNGRGQQPRGVVGQQQVVQPHLLAEIVLRQKTAI